MKPQFNQYKDGFLSVYNEKPRKTNFNAAQNATSIEDLEFLVKLGYEEKTKRIQDLEFAQQNDFSLSLKVKTRLQNIVKNKQKVIISGYLYNIANVDYDKKNQEMYLYLEGVKPIVGANS